MKKMAMVLLCVMVLSAVAIGNEAVAAPPAFQDWYNCTVLSVGAAPGAAFHFYFIFVTNNDAVWAGPRSFLVDSTPVENKTMLASLLTGYASGGQVSLLIPGFTGVVGGPPQNSFLTAAVAGSL